MLENSDRTQREEKLNVVIIQLCPFPYREQMKPLLQMALTLLPDEKLEELENDMVGIPEEVEAGNLDRLVAVGKKFGVGTIAIPAEMAGQLMLPTDGPG